MARIAWGASHACESTVPCNVNLDGSYEMSLTINLWERDALPLLPCRLLPLLVTSSLSLSAFSPGLPIPEEKPLGGRNVRSEPCLTRHLL